jgi:hypothetical protein
MAKKAEILDKMVEDVPVSKLKTYPGNPRKGDVDAIAESLEYHGQFRPIIVQKSTSYVLGGNHTFMAAKKLKWPTIKAVYLDVDDEEAKRIVLADNKLSDSAGYDSQLLAELLASVPDTAGTGYDQQERDALLAVLETATEEASMSVFESNLDALSSVDDPLMSLPDLDEYEGGEEEDTGRPFLDASDELKGPFQLSDDIDIPLVTDWQMPALRQDMMVEYIPDNLQTWAGSATRDIDDDTIWWLYNFGVDSTSGMRDVSKMILSFYAWDEYFENWWWDTAKYMSRALNSGVKMAICPNYTQGDMSRVLSLWNLYRSRYIGRYFQEIGIRVMPDCEILDDKLFYQLCQAITPKNVPWASVQVQNITGSTRGGDRKTSDDVDRWKAQMLRTYEALNKPHNLIVYGNSNGFEMIEEMKLPVDELRFLESRVSKLSERAKGRERKTTL